MRIPLKKILTLWTRMPLVSFAGILLTGSLLSGCQSSVRSTLPTGGPTMAQVYQEALAESDGGSIDTIRQHSQVPVKGREALAGYTRTAQNEVNQLFPALPNPHITLYVFPHLAEEGAPVPGYTTAFRLYEVDHYALPGEVE